MIEAREAIKTLNDLEQRLGLVQTQKVDFFAEWVDDLPSLTAQQQVGIARIKQCYDYTVRAFGLNHERPGLRLALTPER